jgi:glycosidase
MFAGDEVSVILAAVLLMTFPGAPCVYYGDEIGLAGAHDPGCRAGFPWDDPEGRGGALLDAFRSLIRLRHEEPSLRTGAYRDRVAVGDLYAFTRGEPGTGLLVAVNPGSEAAAVKVAVVAGERRWGRGEVVAGRVALPGRSAGVWRWER